LYKKHRRISFVEQEKGYLQKMTDQPSSKRQKLSVEEERNAQDLRNISSIDIRNENVEKYRVLPDELKKDDKIDKMIQQMIQISQERYASAKKQPLEDHKYGRETLEMLVSQAERHMTKKTMSIYFGHTNFLNMLSIIWKEVRTPGSIASIAMSTAALPSLNLIVYTFFGVDIGSSISMSLLAFSFTQTVMKNKDILPGLLEKLETSKLYVVAKEKHVEYCSPLTSLPSCTNADSDLKAALTDLRTAQEEVNLVEKSISQYAEITHRLKQLMPDKTITAGLVVVFIVLIGGIIGRKFHRDGTQKNDLRVQEMFRKVLENQWSKTASETRRLIADSNAANAEKRELDRDQREIERDIYYKQQQKKILDNQDKLVEMSNTLRKSSNLSSANSIYHEGLSRGRRYLSEQVDPRIVYRDFLTSPFTKALDAVSEGGSKIFFTELFGKKCFEKMNRLLANEAFWESIPLDDNNIFKDCKYSEKTGFLLSKERKQDAVLKSFVSKQGRKKLSPRSGLEIWKSAFEENDSKKNFVGKMLNEIKQRLKQPGGIDGRGRFENDKSSFLLDVVIGHDSDRYVTRLKALKENEDVTRNILLMELEYRIVSSSDGYANNGIKHLLTEGGSNVLDSSMNSSSRASSLSMYENNNNKNRLEARRAQTARAQNKAYVPTPFQPSSNISGEGEGIQKPRILSKGSDILAHVQRFDYAFTEETCRVIQTMVEMEKSLDTGHKNGTEIARTAIQKYLKEAIETSKKLEGHKILLMFRIMNNTEKLLNIPEISNFLPTGYAYTDELYRQSFGTEDYDTVLNSLTELHQFRLAQFQSSEKPALFITSLESAYPRGMGSRLVKSIQNMSGPVATRFRAMNTRNDQSLTDFQRNAFVEFQKTSKIPGEPEKVLLMPPKEGEALMSVSRYAVEKMNMIPSDEPVSGQYKMAFDRLKKIVEGSRSGHNIPNFNRLQWFWLYKWMGIECTKWGDPNDNPTNIHFWTTKICKQRYGFLKAALYDEYLFPFVTGTNAKSMLDKKDMDNCFTGQEAFKKNTMFMSLDMTCPGHVVFYGRNNEGDFIEETVSVVSFFEKRDPLNNAGTSIQSDKLKENVFLYASNSVNNVIDGTLLNNVCWKNKYGLVDLFTQGVYTVTEDKLDIFTKNIDQSLLTNRQRKTLKIIPRSKALVSLITSYLAGNSSRDLEGIRACDWKSIRAADLPSYIGSEEPGINQSVECKDMVNMLQHYRRTMSLENNTSPINVRALQRLPQISVKSVESDKQFVRFLKDEMITDENIKNYSIAVSARIVSTKKMIREQRKSYNDSEECTDNDMIVLNNYTVNPGILMFVTSNEYGKCEWNTFYGDILFMEPIVTWLKGTNPKVDFYFEKLEVERKLKSIFDGDLDYVRDMLYTRYWNTFSFSNAFKILR
jgi:hypothetical protein